MSWYWRQHCYGATSFVLLAITALAWISVRPKSRLPQAFADVEAGAGGVVKEETWAQCKTEELQTPADFFVDQERSVLQGYAITRRLRKVFLESDAPGNSSGTWIDVAFINVKKNNKHVKTFDADVYFGPGNSVDFGLFPFLVTRTKQLFISQDIFRGGRQWIVRLSPSFKVIFDGDELGVGREGSDLGAVDLDHDGVFEITAPVTDFYQFHDKLSMSEIPLPAIIFKYDIAKEKYLPANPRFRNYVYHDLEDVPNTDATLSTEHRSAVLSNLLTYIYAGEEQQGWDFYDHNYQLEDKEEIRGRVKEILRKQPVYNLIYKRGKRKSQVP